MPTLIAILGSASANSYLTIAEATTILDDRVDISEDWTPASDDAKARALIRATDRLEQEEYRGCKKTLVQALQWPRYQVPERDNWYYDSESIPKPLLLACAELALELIRDSELFDDTGMEGFDSLSSGERSLTPNGRRAGTLPANIAKHISHIRIGSENVTRIRRG